MDGQVFYRPINHAEKDWCCSYCFRKKTMQTILTAWTIIFSIYYYVVYYVKAHKCMV